MQAIRTKYIGPTNTRPARVKAECERGSLTMEWEYGLNPDGNHRRAALMLLANFAAEDAEKYGKTMEDHHWGDIASGTLADGCGVHVLIGRLGAVVVQRAEAEALRKWREEMKAGRGRGGIELVRLAKVIDAALGN